MRRTYPSKAALWVCAIPCVLLIVAWWVTGWRYFQLMDSALTPRWCVTALRGTVEIRRGVVVKPPMGVPEEPGYSTGALIDDVYESRWGFGASSRSRVNSDEVVIPLWIPLLIVAGVALLPWSRPHRRGCPACGYSRRGLLVWAECPECGSASPARDLRVWW